MPDEASSRRAPRPSRSRRPGKPATFRYPTETDPFDDEPALALLADGELTVEGRLVAASNPTL
jgi:hypothetical protein